MKESGDPNVQATGTDLGWLALDENTSTTSQLRLDVKRQNGLSLAVVCKDNGSRLRC